MKIAFFTEGQYQGKITRDNPNMRTDLAWICSLKADHWNINQPPNQQYDLGIVIIPKKNPQFDLNKLKQYCDKIAVMQEGPNWYWQDYPLQQQIWYFNTIQEADFMFVHNESDKKYYEGLTSKECKILPSLMIEDSIKDLPQVKRDISLLVDDKVESGEILTSIMNSKVNILRDVKLFDHFKNDKIGDSKVSLSFSLVFESFEKTLQDDEIVKAMEKIIKNLESNFDMEVRS